ncbi:hypothetical protein SRHO_G00193040 [Serrasalmus rhombeus]
MATEWVGAIVHNGPQFRQHPPLRHCRQRVQLHTHNITGLADQFIESVGICHPQPASPACNSIEDSTRHHRLIEDPEHSPADVEGPQAPQKIETTLALPVEGISVLSPVQFIVNIHTQIFVILHSVHTDPADGHRGHRCLVPPQVHHQFLCLCHIELQVVPLAPCDKVLHRCPVLILFTLADTSNYCRVIRKLLKVASLCAVAEVRGVEGEEEGREDSTLWDSSVADHSVRHTVLQAYILWSAGQLYNK